jgi:hypothetical protein
MPEPIDEIQNTVSELKGRIDEVSARQNVSSRKNWIDKLSSLSPLISGVLIAGVGTFATISYNNRQMDINLLNVLDKFRPYITSENPVDRQFGYECFVKLDEEAFVVKLIEANNDSAGINVIKSIVIQRTDKETTKRAESVGDEIMAATISGEQKEAPNPILAVNKVSKKEGWAYLGHYVKSSKSWKTRYFEFRSDMNPDGLKGEWLKVREQTGSLNIRSGMPTAMGKFLAVIDVLKPGSEVKIHDIEEWYSTGYMWAKVSYNE